MHITDFNRSSKKYDYTCGFGLKKGALFVIIKRFIYILTVNQGGKQSVSGKILYICKTPSSAALFQNGEIEQTFVEHLLDYIL